MVIVTEEIDLPIAQPKSFQRAIVSPISTHEVHFAHQDDLTPRNKLKGSKSSGLSLSLRRVTPDRFKKDDATTPNSHHSSGASFVSRLTGKGSVYTGATPVMRGSGAHRSKSPGGIERQQKMEDEYYRPPRGGHEEDEEGQEEELDDGELPSLSRISSNGGSRPSSRTRNPRPVITGFWSQDEDDEDEIDRGSNRHASEAAAILAAAAAKAASERSHAAATPKRVSDANNNMVPMNDKDFETLKVAGFWSQLDDVDTIDDDNDSDDDEDDGRLRTVHHNGYEEEEMPNDEQQWRRTQSPAGRGRNSRSLGLDSHKSESNDTGEISSRHTKNTASLLDGKNTNAANGNWNLLEKAACFASGNAAKVQEEEEEEDLHTFDQNSSNNNSDKSQQQSLDRSYQTSASATEGGGTLDNTPTKESKTATTMNNTGTTNNDDPEDRGMLNCIADALGAICGYSTYVGDVNIDSTKNVDNLDSAKKKERALAIIERSRQRRVEGGEYSADEVTDGQPMRSFDSECDEEDYPVMSDSEDAAIELEYLSRDDNEEAANQMTTRESMVTHTVAAGVVAVGAAGLVANTATGKSSYSQPPARSAPMSPNTEKKKKRLTVKSVQNLLGLRKKKDIPSAELQPPSKTTPVNVMPRSVKEQAEQEEINNYAAQLAQSSDEVVDEEDMPEMMDDDSLFEEDAEEDTNVVDEQTLPEDSTSGGLNKYTFNEEDTPKPRTIFDEEELESQAAGWDSNRKNSYLRELAQRAKQEYRAKKSLESHGDPDLTTAVSASMGAAAMAAIKTSRGNRNDDFSRNTQENEIASRSGSQTSYNVDYNSFNPVEKRKFLRLLNSGMSPQDATRIIVDERDGMPLLEDAEDDLVSTRDEEEEDSVATEEGSTRGERQAEEGEAYDDSESLLSHDPPGDVLEGGSGESSTRDIDERVQEVSRSEKATAGETSQESPSDVTAAATAVATAALIPAIVRAKTKSKNSTLQEDDEGNYNEQEMEEKYYPGADGLISVGDKYYDSLRPSYEHEDVDNAFLIGKEKNYARSLSRVKKISKRPSVPSSFAKVASLRALESPRSSSSKFTSVNRNNAIPVRDDDSLDDIVSPKSDASRTPKFNFINRSSKWAKLGSNLDSNEKDDRSFVYEEEEFYSPRSAPMQVEDTKSPVSAPDDERASVQEWVHEQSPASAATSDSPVMKAPSTAASHVALPTLLPESDDRERNVVTPTNEMMGSKDEMLSPDQSTAGIESRANSLFMSPDSMSPTSPQDLGSLTETPSHHNPAESIGTNRERPFHSVAVPAGGAHSSIARSHFNETRKKTEQTSTGSTPASQMPLIPDSPHDRASPNVADQSVANYSLAEQSFVTLGTAWTTASKSSRRRHKGAAGKRLMQAKEAENHAGAKSKGWMGSIRDVAARREQVWDPEKGWVDYSETELTSNFGEAKPIGSLHLTQKITPRKPVRMEAQDIPRDVRDTTYVEFPQEWAAERKDIIKAVRPLSFTIYDNSNMEDDSADIDEKSVFTNDASTINTSVDTLSLLQNTHAPVRRAAPKHRAAADKRKTAAVPGKTVGWKASMEAATAYMNDENRHWDYDHGWTEKNDFEDDVSELTRITLERSPGSETVNSNHARAIETTSHASPTYFLPSVAEEVAEAESSAPDDDEQAMEDEAIPEEHDVTEDSTVEEMSGGDNKDGENDSECSFSNYEQNDDQLNNHDVLIEDSDKENELSRINSEEDSEDASPKLATEEFPLTVTKQSESGNVTSHDSEKPPLPKRSLNQWLVERSFKDGLNLPDVESENAVHSPEPTLDDSSGPSQLSKSLFSTLDDVKVDEATTQEISVVRERCDDNDRGLFQTANDASDIQMDSSGSRENLIMESFETMDSSENEWLETLSTKERDEKETDETSVSSRALAWMSSMEKKTNFTNPLYSENRAVHAKTDPPQAKSDPPQSIDPPSSLSHRATKRLIESPRYSSSTLSSQTLNTSNQRSLQSGVPKKSRVEELISKLENPDKLTQSSYPTTREEEEHDVIFHSNAMGIRLKRGEDGLVRVVSVTESSPGSSIVRVGKIEPDDIVREAAGADLRSPITNSKWGEVVLSIRNASRPMKFVVVSARKTAADDDTEFERSSFKQGQSVVRSPRSDKPISSSKERPPRILFGDDVSVDSSRDDDSAAKQSLFNRIASCATTGPSNGEGNEVPMAHLAFLRTNPTIARVRNEASRRYPALCGRPDTIFEEPEDSEVAPERNSNHHPSTIHRTATPSYDGSHATISAARTPNSAGVTSVTSYTSGDNTAYLKGIASKSAVSNKPFRSRNNNSQKLGQHSTVTGEIEVGWPDGDGQASAREPDTLSTYSSRSHSSFHVQKHKRDTARQAELLAESKVVAMMEHELHHLDSAEECEI
ncbi:hypothetical protein HJC23_010709 [Cyclotella cryptica]|uniref:Uncharacterized protein n=1 Tax=Cyclotella cryptica TaxID=29204 RepID=A0ABD3PI46_9STRA|eukprot:CCRYP_015441-RA/>CCRYP_015441-RA protein AED:0.00 eAED:0.00 QI:237/1/1/1/1/1/2/192/2382